MRRSPRLRRSCKPRLTGLRSASTVDSFGTISVSQRLCSLADVNSMPSGEQCVASVYAYSRQLEEGLQVRYLGRQSSSSEGDSLSAYGQHYSDSRATLMSARLPDKCVSTACGPLRGSAGRCNCSTSLSMILPRDGVLDRPRTCIDSPAEPRSKA